MERVEQAYDEAAGRTKAGTSVNIGYRGNFYSILDSDRFQGFPDQRMSYFVNAVYDFRSGVIADPDGISEAFVDDDIHIAVYGRAHHSPWFVPVELAQVGAATDEADSKRSPRDYH
jgi:hypothetical protein